MNFARHGRRLMILWAVLVLLGGCSPERTSPPARSLPLAALPRKASSQVRANSAIVRIVWGDTRAAGQCAALRKDGGFLVQKTGASSVSPAPETDMARASCLGILQADRLVSGTAEGLILWDTSGTTARPISHVTMPAVRCLLAVADPSGDFALLAGLENGGIVRCSLSRSGGWGRPAEPATTGAAVTNLVPIPGTDQIVVIRSDASAQVVRHDLVGRPGDLGPRQDLVYGASARQIARKRDEFTLQVGPDPPRAFPFAVASTSMVLAAHGRVLIVGVDGGFLIVEIPDQGPISAIQATQVKGMTGRTQIALDPTDPSQLTLAIGDESGSIERLTLPSLRERAVPASLDLVPHLAFEPWKRFDRPRTMKPTGDDSASGLSLQLQNARRKLEAGESIEPLTTLRELAAKPGVDPADHAEVLAAIAAIEARDGNPSDTALRAIRAARDAFLRAHRSDRVADFEFWEGVVRSRRLDALSSASTSRSSDEAIACLLRAADAYRASTPRLDRQAWMATAAAAWALLDHGQLELADVLLKTAIEAAGTDPVFSRVSEIDRIRAAIAMARGEFATAESSYAKLIPTDSPARDRLARLGRAGALAALDRWDEAAGILHKDRPDDPLWSIRRAACLAASGRPVELTTDESDDPIAAHIRAIVSLASPRPDRSRLESDLNRAIDGHRRETRIDLALEAELALAESLAVRGRPAEALALFERVVRETGGSADQNDARRGERPILALADRAARGWVAASLAAHQSDQVSQASNHSIDGSRAALGLNLDEFHQAERLSRQLQTLSERGGPGAGSATAPLEIETRRIETALAGRWGRLVQKNPRQRLEPGDLGLGAGEAILAIAEAGPDGLAGVLWKSDAPPVALMLPLSRSGLTDLVQSWRAGLGASGEPLEVPPRWDSGAIAGLGAEPEIIKRETKPTVSGSHEAVLHDALIAPFRDHLSSITRLFLVPSGPLAGLPVEITGRDQRLLDQFEVSFLPDISFLRAMRDSRRAEAVRSGGVLFLSPNSEREVRAWAVACRETGWKPLALLNTSATKKRLLGVSLEPYEVIHLQAPIEPGGPRGQFVMRFHDGVFTTGDLASLPIRSRVLLLHVQGRKGLTAEGVAAWARAGLLSGAGSVIVTLWEPPPDSSRRFFAEFYKHLKDGHPASYAIARAREAVASMPESRDPIHWAGYAVYEP